MTEERDYQSLSSASLHEAGGKIGALPESLKPLSSEFVVSGPAFPVKVPPGDNLFLHHAIYAASPGDVLVVDAGAANFFGHWGDIMTSAAQLQGLAGLVISGGVRDSQLIAKMGFPVFSTGIGIHGTAKQPDGAGSIGETISLGAVEINQGDFIFGDADGIVCLPKNLADDVIDKSCARDASEDEILERLKAGETTLQIYNLPDRVLPPVVASGIRRSIEVDGHGHGQLPIPAASRVGSIIATGGVRGADPSTGDIPDDPKLQTEFMFQNLKRIIAASGAGVESIIKVSIWVDSPDIRKLINEPWLALFPHEHSRPARHIMNYSLPVNMVVQCEALAIVQD